MASHEIDPSAVYRITVLGLLDGEWAGYFEDLAIAQGKDGSGKLVTTFTGWLADQAALQGTLQKLYALGLPLVSVEKLEPVT